MLSRRQFLAMSSLSAFVSGCGILRIDPWHPFLRSESIQTQAQIDTLLKRVSVSFSDDGRVRVVKLQGDPYEVGFQQGAALQKEVTDSLMSMWDNVMDVYHFEEFFDESYERLRPFIPQAYIDEMHGLAHGARLPLRVVHSLHALPEMTEWGGKTRIKKLIKMMMKGEDLATSCSNIGALPESTADGKMLVVRILDWGLYKISKLHEYPQFTVVKPKQGLAYVNVGWTGFLGAVSGMNEAGITLGEMGYGDPEGETLRGTPMIFLLREILSKAESLNDVRKILREAPGNNSYVFLMSDGKTKEASMFIKDKDRFLEFKPGQDVTEENQTLPGVSNIVYGGHYLDRLTDNMRAYNGEISRELLIDTIIPRLALKGNFHNVIYQPEDLKLWVANGRGKDAPAYQQPYTYFDFKQALASFS
jgi:isopenicillin-N N-acyltransferase-like protein